MTRPITDRVKENLFNIIGAQIQGCTFLDLFAGTGSVGIEAFSRGAKYVHFVEKNRQPYLVLKENLNLIQDKSAFSLQMCDAFSFIPASQNTQYDFVFIAPPQYKGFWEKAVQMIDAHPKSISPQGTMIVQIDPTELNKKELVNFIVTDKRKYGSTLLLFYKHRD